MDEKYVVSVAVPRPLEGFFTYLIAPEFRSHAQVGNWVEVPFGRTTVHGFIAAPPVRLEDLAPPLPKGVKVKSVLGIGDQGRVIPEDVWALCEWAARYYHMPLGEVLAAAIPAASLGLRNRKRTARALSPFDGPAKITVLTEAQKGVVSGLKDYFGSGGEVALLDGVTGSGKTEVYLDLARGVLAQGRSVLVLVPEIALTPQLNRRFETGLGERVALWHSALADGVRRDLSSALRSGEIRVVVGARSAVFAPIRSLGLIVVDEEHDSTYKQEDRFRYQARDLAIVRGKITKSAVVLGSATPSFEAFQRCKEGRYQRFELTARAIAGAELPSIEVVDLTQEERVEGTQAPIALKTLEAIRDTVARGQQVMLFLNRRGFAAFLLCEDCGEVRDCRHCSISLTVHMRSGLLKCHACGYQEPIPLQCGKCEGTQLAPVGAGTESVADQLPDLLPGVRVLRLDRDQVTSSTRLNEVLEKFRNGEADVLLGTQMLVKGHDFTRVTLVVVMLADALFRWPDYRSTERAFQILTQVAGRAGRGTTPGRVLIQTYAPDHPVVRAVQEHRTAREWFDHESPIREELNYPPFGRLVRIRIEASSREEARELSRQVADAIQTQEEAQSAVQVLGPTEAIVERVKDVFRWDLLLKSTDVGALHRLTARTRSAGANWRGRMFIDVDPSGLG